jgi:hypothetical protein
MLARVLLVNLDNLVDPPFVHANPAHRLDDVLPFPALRIFLGVALVLRRHRSRRIVERLGGGWNGEGGGGKDTSNNGESSHGCFLVGS